MQQLDTSSNQRLRDCIRLVALYQAANTSASHIVAKEMKAF